MAIVEFEEGTASMQLSSDKGSMSSPPLFRFGCAKERSRFSASVVDEDAGRYRMTFFQENRRFRLVVEEEGNAIQRSTVDFGDHQLPTSMRKPSAWLQRQVR